MSHLRPDELLDIVEQLPIAPERRAHLDTCAVCQHELERIAAALDEARAVDVPEPSPLFWTAFSARVREAIASEPAAPRLTPHWLDWRVMVPLAGLALLVIAMAGTIASRGVSDGVTPEMSATLIALPAITDMDASDEWLVLEDLIGPLDFEAAQEAGMPTAPGSADEAVLLLTAAEQQELVRLLQQELMQPGG